MECPVIILENTTGATYTFYDLEKRKETINQTKQRENKNKDKSKEKKKK